MSKNKGDNRSNTTNDSTKLEIGKTRTGDLTGGESRTVIHEAQNTHQNPFSNEGNNDKGKGK